MPEKKYKLCYPQLGNYDIPIQYFVNNCIRMNPLFVCYCKKNSQRKSQHISEKCGYKRHIQSISGSFQQHCNCCIIPHQTSTPLLPYLYLSDTESSYLQLPRSREAAGSFHLLLLHQYSWYQHTEYLPASGRSVPDWQ